MIRASDQSVSCGLKVTLTESTFAAGATPLTPHPLLLEPLRPWPMMRLARLVPMTP